MTAAGREVILARTRRPWGLGGELLLELHSDWPEERFAPGTLVELAWDDGRRARVTVRSFRQTGVGPLLGFEQARDLSSARSFSGASVVADAATLPRLADADEWSHLDLVGLTVVDGEGRVLGVVEGIEEGAVQDLARVRDTTGGEVLLPLVPEICVALEAEAGRLVVEPPRGLFDPGQAVEASAPARRRAP